MSQAFDFGSNFVSVDSQEEGAEFEVLNDKGEKTGMFIRLAGPNSKRRKLAKEKLSDAFLALNGDRAAADNDGATARRLSGLQMDDLVAATISWRFKSGVTGPECTPENVRDIYTKHPTLFAQVQKAAEDLKRFTKG